MQLELWKYSLCLMFAGLIGWIIGYPLLTVCIISILCYIWQSYQLHELYQWVRKSTVEPSNSGTGLSYQLHRQLSRRNKKFKEREKLFKSTLSQFRKAASAVPDAIVLVDNHGKIEWANRNSNALLNINWPSDRGVRIGDLLRDPDLSNLLKPENPKIQGIEISLPSNRHQILNLKCIRYTDKLRMIIARDVSRLIKINQLHTDFIANVSHELKTPLTVLKGYIEIAQGITDLPDELHAPMLQMEAQTKRMELIVKDLLYLARLEELADQNDYQNVNISLIVKEIIDGIQPVIHTKKHKIEIDIDSNINLIGNQNELRSAFTNLVSNAINYTDDNGLIRLKWAEESEQGVFSVTDDGVGIPANSIPNLTTRFYRVDDDRSRQSGGTGLGLAIVKHVLQRHNAHIEIHSQVGNGSQFRCVFPESQLVRKNSGKKPQQNLNPIPK